MPGAPSPERQDEGIHPAMPVALSSPSAVRGSLPSGGTRTRPGRRAFMAAWVFPRPCRREARAEAASPQATDGAAGGLRREPAAPSRAALDHAPPIGVITLPLPSQSGQVLPSTLPVPSQLRQVFSPDPGAPGGTASGFSVWLTAGTPFPWSSRSLTRSTEAADVCSRPSEPRGRQERQAGQGSCPGPATSGALRSRPSTDRCRQMQRRNPDLHNSGYWSSSSVAGGFQQGQLNLMGSMIRLS